MKRRILSGIVIFILVVAAGLAGGNILAAAMLCISLTGFYELMKVCGVLQQGQKVNAITLPAYGMTILYYVGLAVLANRDRSDPEALVHSGDYFTIAVIAVTFLIVVTVYVLRYPGIHLQDTMCVLFSFLYVPLLLSFVYRARMLPYGIFVYALIFVCSSICDVCALAAGMLFGRHKMAPVLSPKKTIEGAVGGVLGSALVSFLVSLVIYRIYPQEDLRLAFTILGACGALLGMAGDLAASAIKREHGIKDYGTLIPGHGGIMDRFDSIIFTAPVIYFLGTLMLSAAGQ